MIHGSEKVGDRGIAAIGEACSSLEYLDMGRCYGVSDIGMRALAMGCKKITYLDMSGCAQVSGAGIIAIGTYLKSLTHLDISGCSNIKPYLFQRIADGEERAGLGREGEREREREQVNERENDLRLVTHPPTNRLNPDRMSAPPLPRSAKV